MQDRVALVVDIGNDFVYDTSDGVRHLPRYSRDYHKLLTPSDGALWYGPNHFRYGRVLLLQKAQIISKE